MHVGWLSACTIFFCFLVQDRFVNALPWSVALMFNWQITSELKDREFVFFFLSENMLEGSVPLYSWYEWCSRLGTTRNFRQYHITFWSTARTSLGSDPSHGPTLVELLQHLFIKGVPSAESPRLEPGTFRSQVVRFYRLHQARHSCNTCSYKMEFPLRNL